MAGMKKMDELTKLTQKYYGYVADLEGSPVEILEMLFVRDGIQQILGQMSPDESIPQPLYEQIYALDAVLWQNREVFLMVVGEKELEHARKQQKSSRAHWWWYLDELKGHMKPEDLWKHHWLWEASSLERGQN